MCSLVIPAVSLKLFGFISRVRVWRSCINNKSLLGITHATALNGKTQAGACESHLKLFILQFMQWKGDEPPLQPLCRKGCLNHGLASCFTHMKRWGFARVSWEHWSPRIYLSVSAFVPSVLPRDRELKPLWERKMQGGGWSSSDLCWAPVGFLRRALVPQHRKGSEKRAYVTSQHIPESLALSKHQGPDCFWGPVESGQFERGHLYTGLERQVQGWKFWGIIVRLFFNLFHLYYCITPFPKTG